MDINQVKDLDGYLHEERIIPRIGYWGYLKDTNEFYWSKGTHMLLGWNNEEKIPNFEEFLALVHKDDLNNFMQAMEQLFSETNDGYGIEIRLQHNNGHYNWYQVIGRKDNNLLHGVIIDISKRKHNEETMEQLHKQLLVFARHAGMGEVAISVIHNVGNVLNGAMISISLVQEKLQNSSLSKMFNVIDLIKEHRESINDYLTKDPRGCKIPEYLIGLGDFLTKEYKSIKEEINNINKCIEHIKDVIRKQESVGNILGINEQVILSEVIDTSIQLSGDDFVKKGIELHKNTSEPISITIDKSKLMQILVNLIKNAKDAVLMDPQAQKREINISVNKLPEQFSIIIEDSGPGIDPKNLSKIFSFGFTTKVNGHGFGLHNSALKAKEMGGSLTAENKVNGTGAVFILSLPYNENKD